MAVDEIRGRSCPFELGFAILEEHGDHLFEVLPQFVD
jgi:hypothetical protein